MAIALTQAVATDQLAHFDSRDSYMCLSSGLDPQDLTDLLDSRYGTPRTLVGC
ncbi:hypothetical protein [Streptomyces sp. NPDC002779]|uniref:hypothetical protein n=1 Tax=Streptomyces sp. NPDC002779 TaxID=3364664 RepID=UPI003675565F